MLTICCKMKNYGGFGSLNFSSADSPPTLQFSFGTSIIIIILTDCESIPRSSNIFVISLMILFLASFDTLLHIYTCTTGVQDPISIYIVSNIFIKFSPYDLFVEDVSYHAHNKIYLGCYPCSKRLIY